MSERKIFNFESKVLVEKTIEMEGCSPEQFGKTSHKFIWATCRFCGEPSRIRKGFFIKAGSACHKECRFKEQSVAGSPFANKDVRDKAKKTNLERYGSESAQSSEIVRKKISIANTNNKEKRSKTNLERYGVENTFQSEEIKNKIKKTNLEKYGFESAMQNKNVKEKAKETNRRRYGHDNPMQNDEIKQKAQQSVVEKYGVPYVTQNKDIKLKIIETNIDKYGVSSPMQNNEIKEKVKNTLISKYGHPSTFEVPEIKEKIKQTFLSKYGVENPFLAPEIRQKIENIFLEKYNVKSPFESPEIRQKIIDSFLNKYGVDNPAKDPHIKSLVVEKFKNYVKENREGKFDVINTLRSDEIWKKMEEGLSLQQISKDFDLHYPSLASALNEEEFKKIYNEIYTYPKQQMQNSVKNDLLSLGNLDIIVNTRKMIPPLELDIFISDKKFAIEFNGNYWHSEATLETKEAQDKHITKTKLCRENGIRLVHIFQNTWDNRKSQVMNFLKSSLGLNKQSVFARKCIITNSSVPDFIDNNHIQKCPSSTTKFFNLVHNDEVVGSMTAAKHHRQNASENDIVLSRLCFKDGMTVVGGASKLFAVFKEWAKTEGYKSIISWSDSLWTEGNIYKILGFALEEEYGPDYFYWDAKNNRYLSKQSQKKSNNGCPADMTERDWCYQNGLFRIWDCGKKKWTLKC